AAEESRKMINSWVESETNERIKDLFPKDSLDSTTVLVLVNAVYFKGQWNQKFKKESTAEEEFWLNKDTSKPVQMMKQTNSFNFVSLEDVQAKILEIPYKGGELSMLVLLPSEVDGLQEVRPGVYSASRCCGGLVFTVLHTVAHTAGDTGPLWAAHRGSAHRMLAMRQESKTRACVVSSLLSLVEHREGGLSIL
ncbi:serpin B4-like, partial [Oryx dammah]|uniref:serpin B4-like n=1 Tax=Oryx dammah TaxID=59534 RepID=UPI001A9AA565